MAEFDGLSKAQGVEGLVEILLLSRHVHEHHRLAVSLQMPLQYSRESAAPEGRVLPVLNRPHHFAQLSQRLVDLLRLLKPGSSDSGVLLPLTSGQVDQNKAAPAVDLHLLIGELIPNLKNQVRS